MGYLSADMHIFGGGSRGSRGPGSPGSAGGAKGNIPFVTERDFEQQVLLAETPVLVQFTADWCQPCMTIAPEVEAFARIENHYFVNRGFFERDGQLLEGIDRIRHLPCVIVQGRYDVVCPVRSAWDLHRAWPESELIVNTRAGHSMFDPENAAALVQACDRFRS